MDADNEPDDDGEDVIIKVLLPLPLDVASALMLACDKLWPGAAAVTERHNTLSMQIRRRWTPISDMPIGEAAPGEPPEWTAILRDVAGGGMRIDAPEQIAKLIGVFGFHFLDEHDGAVNYVETAIVSADGARRSTIIVMAESPAAKTPHQLRRDAEDNRDRLLDRLQGLIGDPITQDDLEGEIRTILEEAGRG